VNLFEKKRKEMAGVTDEIENTSEFI